MIVESSPMKQLLKIIKHTASHLISCQYIIKYDFIYSTNAAWTLLLPIISIRQSQIGIYCPLGKLSLSDLVCFGGAIINII